MSKNGLSLVVSFLLLAFFLPKSSKRKVVRTMFHESSAFSKIVTYAVNGIGLVLLVFNSAEIMTFLPPEVIAYALGIANILKRILTEGPVAVLPPKA